MTTPSLLIVDDEKTQREGLRAALEDRYDVYLAEDAKTAIDLLEKEHFDVLLTDFRLPSEDGMKLIARAKSLSKPPICILMTAYGSEELAVEAMKRGADDYIAKGRLQIDELEMRIARALRQQNLETENVSLRRQLDSKFGMETIVGESPAMKEVLDLVQQVAPARSTVLLQGESGTGKELIAKALHLNSPRSDRAFVPVNTGSMPTDLLESTLFGHVKGAFTSAIASKKGLFEIADRGTLFLDEIGTMGLETQSKILRVLQDRKFMHLGGVHELQVDVRIIAATNVDLRQLVREGKFREDLFYRLNVITIDLPPLRQRKEDIPLLVEFFLRKYSEENQRSIERVTPEAMRPLLNYSWAGNVRELENVIERAVVLSSGSEIGPELLPDQIAGRGTTFPLLEHRGDASLFDIMEDC